ncbi:hypothetical protein [Actinomadura verrucosospora]|uniref:Uncharacterized protein n=1 Tax=Actinomadura verrucosospora TaxID=46165 RepID=A0A7D3VXS1_ACTVE|nr:hypothetical protein [Actinomadura verrucosospora]QKG21696.1 hypothetical protein ACTIVE_3334 [Actinomadura verrucosospora]
MNHYQPADHRPSGLIIEQGEVRIGDRGPHPRPGAALVCSDREGRAVTWSRRPSIVDAPRLRRWYLVDVTRHQDTIAAEVPSRWDAMRFQLEADVQWAVTDAAVVVDQGLADGLAVVRSRSAQRNRGVTRRHDIDDCDLAERELQDLYDRGPMVLGEGITIYSAVIRMHIDDPTARFQNEQRQIERTRSTERQNATLERERIDALRSTAKGEDDLLFLFLARHPDQVGSVLQSVAHRREITQKMQLDIFDRMVREGFIQEADIEPMRRLLLTPMEQVADVRSLDVLGQAALPAAAAPADSGGGDAGTGGAADDADTWITAKPVPPPEPEPGSGPPEPPPAPAPSAPPPANGVSGWKAYGRDQHGRDQR